MNITSHTYTSTLNSVHTCCGYYLRPAMILLNFLANVKSVQGDTENGYSKVPSLSHKAGYTGEPNPIVYMAKLSYEKIKTFCNIHVAYIISCSQNIFRTFNKMFRADAHYGYHSSNILLRIRHIFYPAYRHKSIRSL